MAAKTASQVSAFLLIQSNVKNVLDKKHVHSPRLKWVVAQIQHFGQERSLAGQMWSHYSRISDKTLAWNENGAIERGGVRVNLVMVILGCLLLANQNVCSWKVGGYMCAKHKQVTEEQEEEQKENKTCHC